MRHKLKNNPKVSLIIPVYNVEKYLPQCLDSVINQTLKEIEIIIIDDGSKDSSGKIADKYAKKDNRIKVFHRENGGYGKAVNFGISQAKGECIGIVESDDWIELDMYEQLYTALITSNAQISKARYKEFYQTTQEFRTVNWEKSFKSPPKIFKIEEFPIFLYFHPSIWTCLYRKDFLQKHKICMSEIAGASWNDNPFQIETMIKADKICYIDKAFYNYRQHYLEQYKALKDCKIPFERTKEIHNWLRKNKIVSPDIWACLYKREIAYIMMILKAFKFSDFVPTKKMITLWLRDFDPHIVNHNLYITKKEKIFLQRLKKNYTFWAMYYKYFKSFPLRKFLISFNISGNGFFIQILGFQFSKGKYINCPAFLSYNIRDRNK